MYVCWQWLNLPYVCMLAVKRVDTSTLMYTMLAVVESTLCLLAVVESTLCMLAVVEHLPYVCMLAWLIYLITG